MANLTRGACGAFSAPRDEYPVVVPVASLRMQPFPQEVPVSPTHRWFFGSIATGWNSARHDSDSTIELMGCSFARFI
jgi:hypothetical protein